jgi:hypothetical protein
MEVVGQETLMSFSARGRLEKITCLQVRKNKGIAVRDYFTLATKIAQLQFFNPHYVMLFRGQIDDYVSKAFDKKDISPLRPKIFRFPPDISSKFDN